MKPYIHSKSDALMERAKRLSPAASTDIRRRCCSPRARIRRSSHAARARTSGTSTATSTSTTCAPTARSCSAIGIRASKKRCAARWISATASMRRARVWVELAEYLVSITPFADWTVFAKNGSDVCTWATEVARHATGRPKIAMCQGAYHGAHAWCTPAPNGVMPEDRANIVYFRLQRSRESARRGRGKQRQARGRDRLAVPA